MNTDNEQNKLKLHLLVEKLRTSDDRELLHYLMDELTPSLSETEKIDQIYEYCIERIARQQAKQFYSSFPIKEIVPLLIEDFIRMERFRRQDAFDDFSLALYQQIERINNAFSKNEKFVNTINKMWQESAFVEEEWEDGKRLTPDVKNRVYNGRTIAQFIFFGVNKKTGKPCAEEKILTPIEELAAYDKIRIVVYYLIYSASLIKNQQNDYTSYTKLLFEIYQCRNRNHRATGQTTQEQKFTEEILPKSSYYYLVYSEALARYVEGISKGFDKLIEIEEYANKL